MLRIGLTGGIATGKSTVSDMFKEYGVPVIDTDLIAFTQLEKGTITYHEIVTAFGEKILYQDQTINRDKLGRIVFRNKKKRELLNAIVHPRVLLEVDKQLEELKKQNPKMVVIDVPLLYEAQLENRFDKIIVVYVSKATQIERLVYRDNINKEYADQKIKAQIDIEIKKQKADYIVDNSKSIIETKKAFTKIIKELEVL